MSEARLARLVAAHDAVFVGLLDATSGLDEAAWATPTGCPGWDVHDQLAHCVGVERMMLGDPRPDIQVPDLPHIRGPMGEVTEVDVQVRRGVPGDELCAEARDTFDRRMAALEGMLVADLDEEIDSPIGRHRASKVLRIRVFDLVAHEQDIRRALDRETDPVGSHLELALEQLRRAWAAILPSRLPGSGTIRLDLAGREPLELDLGAGEGRTDDGTRRDASIELTAAQALALGCGRDDAPGRDQLHAGGDEGLVAAFLDAASVTP